MERLTSIEQLKKGDKFYVIDSSGTALAYEFLCIHPNNDKYILAIDNWTKDAPKLYIPSLLEKEVYVGKYDTAFFLKKEIEIEEKWLQDKKDRLNRIINKSKEEK